MRKIHCFRTVLLRDYSTIHFKNSIYFLEACSGGILTQSSPLFYHILERKFRTVQYMPEERPERPAPHSIGAAASSARGFHFPRAKVSK